MNKIKDYNLVCTNLNNRCHLTCGERTGSIVSVFLGKADVLCADPRMLDLHHTGVHYTCKSNEKVLKNRLFCARLPQKGYLLRARARARENLEISS